jgi:hypothetical protein
MQPRTPRYPAHVTVVRDIKEFVVNKGRWFEKEGHRVGFCYAQGIGLSSKYAWINCYSIELENIRQELGLPRVRRGFECFHCTIANFKPSQSKMPLVLM